MLAVAHRAPADPARAARLAAAGAGMFELDIQLRGSGVVVSHYLPFGRFGVQRDNWRLRVGAGRDLSVAEALRVLPGDVDVLLDPKHHRGFAAEDLVGAVAAVVADQPDRFVVSTGRPELLRAYRALGLRTWRSIGDRVALRQVLSGDRLPDDGVSVRHSLLDAETVRALHGITGIIAAWTVNHERRALHLADLGVDAITTDRPTVLQAVAGHVRPGASGERQ